MSASDVVELAKPPARPVDVGERARLAARRRDRILSIASPLGLLLAWELAADTGLIDVRFLSGAERDHRQSSSRWRAPASSPRTC